jgi:RNA polymerase sigma factor (sigma-70 family)
MTDGSDSIHGNLPITYEYMDKIYGFCYKRIRNSCDAEDLAQEIMLEVIRAWNSGVRPGKYHAWLWSVARNRWCKCLERRKRSMYNIPYLEGGQLIGTCQGIGGDPMDEELVDSEEKHEVSRVLSRLSQVYREMVVLYYLKMKTIPEIACLLSIPEGTVKRRLHNARQQVKEGLKNMQENGRRSYALVDLNLWGGYSIPKYWPHLDRTLTKNIFAAAYDEPITVEQLSEELGVASAYIEEELQKLVEWLIEGPSNLFINCSVFGD